MSPTTESRSWANWPKALGFYTFEEDRERVGGEAKKRFRAERQNKKGHKIRLKESGAEQYE